ncbi:hypothetical protein GCM10009647_061440 [Streptomyces sanglieri]
MKVRAWLSHSAPIRRPFVIASSLPVPLGPVADSPGPQDEAPRTAAPIPAIERRAERREGRWWGTVSSDECDGAKLAAGVRGRSVSGGLPHSFVHCGTN